MTNPSQNLRAIEVIAGHRYAAWSKFRAAIHQRKQPPILSGSGGDGRGSDISDPVGNAVAHMSYWEEYEFDAAALTEKILGSMRELETMMNTVLHVPLTEGEKEDIRCSGKVDATCTENASVGPTGRADRAGLCLKCYWADYRAKQKVDA